mmetsp:Transcript_3386/g.8813  ORF Transcript_3386/g.8813 Transcript_3386/m.8813 type:complete len:117 (-) Transcript_3386:91-441(-)
MPTAKLKCQLVTGGSAWHPHWQGPHRLQRPIVSATRLRRCRLDPPDDTEFACWVGDDLVTMDAAGTVQGEQGGICGTGGRGAAPESKSLGASPERGDVVCTLEAMGTTRVACPLWL